MTPKPTDGEIALYVVKTKRHEPKEQAVNITENVYRVLARSVTEAAEIVGNSCGGVDEHVRSVVYASHITQLPTNKFKPVAVGVAVAAERELSNLIYLVRSGATREQLENWASQALADFNQSKKP